MTTEEFRKMLASKCPWYKITTPEEYRREEEERQRRREEELARMWAEAEKWCLLFRMLEDNISLFWETPGLYVLDPEGRLPSKEIYSIYKNWCIRKRLPLRPEREFLLYTKKHSPSLCLTHSTHIPDGTGKRVRGFYGIRHLKPPEEASSE